MEQSQQKEKIMIRKKKNNKNDIETEYLYYLMNDLGLLRESELYDAGITPENWDNPTEETLEKLENYKNNRRK